MHGELAERTGKPSGMKPRMFAGAYARGIRKSLLPGSQQPSFNRGASTVLPKVQLLAASVQVVTGVMHCCSDTPEVAMRECVGAHLCPCAHRRFGSCPCRPAHQPMQSLQQQPHHTFTARRSGNAAAAQRFSGT